MTRPATTITSLELARWLEMPHEEMLSQIVNASEYLQWMGVSPAALQALFPPAAIEGAQGQELQNGYDLPLSGLQLLLAMQSGGQTWQLTALRICAAIVSAYAIHGHRDAAACLMGRMCEGIRSRINRKGAPA